MKTDEINKMINNINANIHKCHILKQMLKDKMVYGSVDYSCYHDKGYDIEEIKIGEELIDLYIILNNYIQKNI